MYGVLFYVIMAHIARNLNMLRDQLQHVENEGVHTMHSVIYSKYIMFKYSSSSYHCLSVICHQSSISRFSPCQRVESMEK